MEHRKLNDYYAVRAINASALRAARHSLAAARATIDGEASADSSSTLLGRIIHHRVLQRDQWDELCCVVDDRRTKDGRARAAEAELAGKLVVNRTQFIAAMAVEQAIERHPMAKAAIDQCDQRELPVYWSLEGVPCKALIDGLCRRRKFFVDLKTTAIPLTRWAEHFARYGAWLQLPWYSRALLETGRGGHAAMVIVVQSEPPHEVAVFGADESWTELGQRTIDSLLPRVIRAWHSNQWPGAFDSAATVPLVMPEYLRREIESEIRVDGLAHDALLEEFIHE